MPGGLLTDLYELNMAASYLRRDMDGLATFSLYVRGLPPQRGFLVAAGLESCLDFLASFSFTDDELATLGGMGFDDRALTDLAALRFDGEVWAMPEGTIVYSEEPLLEVTAPVAVAQIVETYLLNQITLHTTLASKAARYVLAADGHDLRGLRLPAHARHRGGHGDRTRQRHGGVRRHLERRGGAPVRSDGGGHDGPRVHRSLPERT